MSFQSRKTSRPRGLAVMGAITALAALGTATSAQAAKATLGNGDQLTGEIVQMKDQQLTLRSPVFGEVKIPWAQVAELKSDEGVRIQLANGALIEGPLVLRPDGQVVVAEPGTPTTVARADVALLNPPVVDDAVKYSGHATVGGTFNRGNSRDDAVNLDAELVARTPANRYTLGAEAHEAKSSGLQTTSNSLLSAQYDRFLNKKDYVFLKARAQRDELADLNLRTTLGAGYGRQFVETDALKLSAEAGLNYIDERYKLTPDKSFPALSLGLNYEQKFFDNKLVLFNKTDVSVSLNQTSDTLVKNKLGFRVPIASGLNLSTQLNLSFDRSPPPGIKKTDTNLVVGVGYAF